MDHTSSRVREFVRWASEEGREEMLNSISLSPRYAGKTPQVIEGELDDNLGTIKTFGLVVGAVRVRILVEEYAPACPNAPIVSTEDLVVLESRYEPVTYR